MLRLVLVKKWCGFDRLPEVNYSYQYTLKVYLFNRAEYGFPKLFTLKIYPQSLILRINDESLKVKA